MFSSSSGTISTVESSFGAVCGTGASAVGGKGLGGDSVEPPAMGKNDTGGRATFLRGRGGIGMFFTGGDESGPVAGVDTADRERGVL